MKISQVGLILVFAANCVFAGMQAYGPRDGLDLPATDLDRVHEGTPAPDFTLLSRDNRPITLSSFRGRKNVVLVFYRGYW